VILFFAASGNEIRFACQIATSNTGVFAQRGSHAYHYAIQRVDERRDGIGRMHRGQSESPLPRT
jgi:hypothetical protein